MKRRAFLKAFIAVMAMPSSLSVVSMPEKMFSAQSIFINRVWAKKLFEYALEDMDLTKFVNK